MTEEKITLIIKKQRKFFLENKTKNISFRKLALFALKNAVVAYKDEIAEALYLDLGKTSKESYDMEIAPVLKEINYMLRHIGNFSRAKRVPTTLANFPSKSFVKSVPYGNVLIMSPWNYPFLLTIQPLIDALAAGNTAVVKPSAYSVYTSKMINKMIRSIFPERYVAVVTGTRGENEHLLEHKFDYIFFTGSQKVGKHVMEKASKHLTPLTLELGGKNPCVVDKNVDLEMVVKKIVEGKFVNCGQSCVVPDYVYCHEEVYDRFVHLLKLELISQYGENPLENKNYGKIINPKHFFRISALMEPDILFYGGKRDITGCRIEPTILTNVTRANLVMQEEIFGPVLPILRYNNYNRVVYEINNEATPLALYIFTDNMRFARKFMNCCQFGGGCVNDIARHLDTTKMGFGGVGESGMGAYHGKTGFKTFSHTKSIVQRKRLSMEIKQAVMKKYCKNNSKVE